MNRSRWLRWLPGPGRAKQASSEQLERLRSDFKARYHRFKLLLTANNKALDIMAELEEAMAGRRPLGMNFVRSRCTRVATNVYQIIKNLDEIAPGKYEQLYERFRDIQGRIDPFLVSEVPAEDMPFVIPLRRLDRSKAHLTGLKMASLGELGSRVGLEIPEGFVITAHAYRRFMEHEQLKLEIDELIQATEEENLNHVYELGDAIRKMIVRSRLPEDVEAAVTQGYRRLEEIHRPGVLVAMRSSALGEDTVGVSFAGQYRTEFNVNGKTLVDAYKRVVASKYSVQAVLYRLHRGIRDDDVAMCVGCTPIVDAVSGGVAYSRNPLDVSDESIIIHSVWGLPKTIVDGSVLSDVFVISRDDPSQIREKEIRFKERKFACDPGDGLCHTEKAAEDGGWPSLDDEQARELARQVLKIEAHYGSPQDIEWALKRDGTFVILQCRSLLQMDHQAMDLESVDGDRVIHHGGITASPGVASGPVQVVRNRTDALRFPHGGVLVVSQPLPHWASLMNRATAVVAEQGSIAGHLASVARELGVPALFAVERATGILENGTWITVAASTKRIYEGRIERLPRQAETARVKIEGSPVYRSLRGVAEQIVPLDLLEPDAPDFKPVNCRTFHDITRFCHEKAVAEMFQFGLEHSFPERSARQLHCNVPMQFWIIDLDDGIVEKTRDDRYIWLEEIVSVPMLALWRGMTALPWQGPPPVDTRGFVSVLLQSTSDPHLLPTTPSPYVARNYFMISRNFCSLQSRFGYHFSTVEALVGERGSENYVSFLFKGGAADLRRRVGRAHLVAEILEEHDFLTSLDRDSVRARIEGHDQSSLELRLQILGYLSIHTRQLDMIMENEASIARQKQRIRDDLAKIAAERPGRM